MCGSLFRARFRTSSALSFSSFVTWTSPSTPSQGPCRRLACGSSGLGCCCWCALLLFALLCFAFGCYTFMGVADSNPSNNQWPYGTTLFLFFFMFVFFFNLGPTLISIFLFFLFFSLFLHQFFEDDSVARQQHRRLFEPAHGKLDRAHGAGVPQQQDWGAHP